MGRKSYSILSFLFYLFYRIRPAEWLIAIVLVWWGVVRAANGKPASAWFVTAVMLVLVGLVAKSMEYVLFVPSEGPAPRGAPAGPIDGLATGMLLRYLHPSLPLITERFHQAAHVRAYWMDRDRPPHLLIRHRLHERPSAAWRELELLWAAAGTRVRH